MQQLPQLRTIARHVIVRGAWCRLCLRLRQIQKVVCAFYSAVRGGLLVTRGALRVLSRRKIVHIDPDETYLDEATGWTVAAIGFGVQLSLGFNPPWVVSILLWPLGVSEAALAWAVNSPGPRGAPPA